MPPARRSPAEAHYHNMRKKVAQALSEVDALRDVKPRFGSLKSYPTTDGAGLKRGGRCHARTSASPTHLISDSLFGALLMVPMLISARLDPRRRLVSRIGNWWGRSVLRLTGISATVIGAELLPPPTEPIMYDTKMGSYMMGDW